MSDVEVDLLDYFNSSDVNRNGLLQPQELQQCLSNGTWKPFSLATVKLLVHLFDTSHRGSINFAEFQDLWTYVSTWQSLFTSYDRENRLCLTVQQVHEALTDSGYTLPAETVHLLVSKFSPTRQEIDFDDFVHLSILVQRITKAFVQLDVNKTGNVTLTYKQASLFSQLDV